MLRTRLALNPAAAASGSGCARSRLNAIAVLLLIALPATLAAAPWSDAVLADCRLTVHARQALLHDNLLRDLNLGVSVRNYVATLWGPVPSKILSERAAERVRRVPGVADVVNRLVVETPGDPLLEFLRTAPAKPSAALIKPPALLTGQEPQLIPALIWHPANRGEFPKQAPLPPRKPVALMPPIPLPTPAASPPSR